MSILPYIKKSLDIAKSFFGLEPTARTFVYDGSTELESPSDYFYRLASYNFSKMFDPHCKLNFLDTIKFKTCLLLGGLLNFAKYCTVSILYYLPPYSRELYTIAAAEKYTDSRISPTIRSLKDRTEDYFRTKKEVISAYIEAKENNNANHFVKDLLKSNQEAISFVRSQCSVRVGCIEENFLFGSIYTPISMPISFAASNIVLSSGNNALCHEDAFLEQIKAGLDACSKPKPA